MFTKLFTYLLILVTVTATSCGEYPCAKADLRYRLIGFSDVESDTIILRRLQKNNSVIKDSFVFNETNPIRFSRFGDTLIMVAYLSDALLQSDFDYQMFFPGPGRLFRITDINEVQSYGKNSGPFNTSKVGCGNVISGCKVDGQPANTTNFPNTIYLKK
jgi:hypothetical protein